jgi:hypothetical protein
MNSFVAERFSERVQRLALGIEPIDAARGQPMLTPVRLTHDDAFAGNPRQAFLCHPSNRQTLVYDAYYAAQARTVALRLFDQAGGDYAHDGDRRRFVPRRLHVTLPTLAGAELAAPEARACRPYLYPGAAYPVADARTGLRAHVMLSGPAPLRPARWARVLATVPATQPDPALASVVGRAFCDERGEFLLLIGSNPDAIGSTSTLAVRLHVLARPTVFLPPGAVAAGGDPLWDLPIETPASLADDDPVLRGELPPAGVVAVASRVVQLPLGRLLRGQAPLLI